jgi:hypothetical protein
MTTKISLEQDFARFYLITWGTQILSKGEAQRFVQGVKVKLGLKDSAILKFFRGLLEEGVVLSEEVKFIEDYLGGIG